MNCYYLEFFQQRSNTKRSYNLTRINFYFAQVDDFSKLGQCRLRERAGAEWKSNYPTTMMVEKTRGAACCSIWKLLLCRARAIIEHNANAADALLLLLFLWVYWQCAKTWASQRCERRDCTLLRCTFLPPLRRVCSWCNNNKLRFAKDVHTQLLWAHARNLEITKVVTRRTWLLQRQRINLRWMNCAISFDLLIVCEDWGAVLIVAAPEIEKWASVRKLRFWVFLWA